MNTKHFRTQLNIPEGGIEIQFDLESDGDKTNITTIQVHSNFGTSLPVSPELKFHQGKWKLYKEYTNENGEKTGEYFDSNITYLIISEIFRIKEENTAQV